MKTAIRTGIVTILAFFGGLGTWALVAPLDSAVVGSGSLIIHGNRKTVQHREGGIVAELLVHEGAVVEQGQVLVRLDDTQARASYTVHHAQLLADRALVARCLAELSDAQDIEFLTELDDNEHVATTIRERERLMFRSRRDMLFRQLAIIDKRVEQGGHQSRGVRIQLESAIRQLGFAEQELRAVSTLERSGLASKNRLLEVSRAAESLRGQVGQLSTEVVRLEAQVIELEAEKLRLREVLIGEATRDLREAQIRINDVIPRLAADRDILARLEIRAPIAGEVVNLTIFTRGGVIEPGRALMDIVPTTREIVAEAEIQPEDVERLRVGQEAQVIAVGSSPRETAPIHGVIRVVSADKLSDPRTGRAYFRAEVGLLDKPGDHRLLGRLGPGMPVQVIVPIAPRTVFDYLTAPLRESFRSAGREF